jgi:SAM-dependent methyltransferase
METRTNRDVIEGELRFAGAVVVDVGCGDGSLVRLLARKGAHVTGVDVSDAVLARARSAEPVADERYLAGKAEDLPLDPAAADIVVFFNSLHHVDAERMASALHEAARVLKPGGTLYVSEPLAEGSYFEVVKPVHDETEVRRRAHESLGTAAEFGFDPVSEIFHLNPMPMKSFEAFRTRIETVNPETRPRFEALDGPLREAFARSGRQTGDGWLFDQPMRVNIFRKRAA